jgi:hypothetical protein
MSHSPTDPSRVVDYATPSSRRTAGTGQLLVWLMPLWCFFIIMLSAMLRLRDDPFWFIAMGLAFIVGFACAARRRWKLAIYSFAIGLLVIAVGVLLPSLNHAT